MSGEATLEVLVTKDGLIVPADELDKILEAAEMKMDLSMHMMSAIKSGVPFGDLYLIAKAYLP